MIFMAMEEHEEGSDLKGQQLVQSFKNKFKII